MFSHKANNLSQQDWVKIHLKRIKLNGAHTHTSDMGVVKKDFLIKQEYECLNFITKS